MLTYLTSGESHGPQLTAVIDGLPAGMVIDISQINFQLSRRQKGYGRGGRMKIERDQVEIVSGIRHGKTLGGPITLVIRNRDWENWRKIMDPIKSIGDDLSPTEHKLAYDTNRPRPGHADLPGAIKWNHHDMRNVLERASARETSARVAVGSLARQLLTYFGVKFASHVIRIGKAKLPEDLERPAIDEIIRLSEESEVRCIDKDTELQMIDNIKDAIKAHDTLGGVSEIIVQGLPIGLGGFSQWYHRLDGQLAGAMMAIHSVKGVEIGLGFGVAERMGSQVHDELFHDPTKPAQRKGYYRKSNNAGGLEGGITNGENIVIHVAGKPISTLMKPLQTVDVTTKKAGTAIVERSDTCVTPALAVIGEAVAALVLAEAFLEKFGADNIAETERNYNSFLKTEF